MQYPASRPRGPVHWTQIVRMRVTCQRRTWCPRDRLPRPPIQDDWCEQTGSNPIATTRTMAVVPLYEARVSTMSIR